MLRTLATRRIPLGAVRDRPYERRIASLRPIGYWPLGDNAGSSTAVDASGQGRHGTASGITFGVPGSGDALTAARWSGSAGSINLTAALAGLWNGNEGSLVLRYKTASLSSGTRWLLSVVVDANNQLDIYADSGSIGIDSTSGGVFQSYSITPLSPPDTWTDLAVTWSATAQALVLYLNGTAQRNKSPIGTWAGTPTAIRVGSNNAGSGGFWANDLAHVALFDRALPGPDLTYAAGRVGQLLIDGDSRSNHTYHQGLMADATVDPLQWGASCYAVSGSTTSQFLSRAATGISLANRAAFGRRQIMVLLGGVNDGRAGVSAASIWANLQAHCIARRNEGVRAVLCTEIDAQDASANANGWHSTVLPALNTLIRAGWANVAEALVDLGADSRLADATNGTYFNGDLLHPNATGYGVMQSLITPVARSVMQS